MTVVTFRMSKIDAFGGFAKSVWLFFSAANNVVLGPYGVWLCNDQRKSSVTLAVWGWYSRAENFPPLLWQPKVKQSCLFHWIPALYAATFTEMWPAVSFDRWLCITFALRHCSQLVKCRALLLAFVCAGKSTVILWRGESSSGVIVVVLLAPVCSPHAGLFVTVLSFTRLASRDAFPKFAEARLHECAILAFIN